MNNLLKYNRDQIQQFVRDGICPVETLRDYDIVKALAQGEKVQNVAFDNRLSREQVWRVKNKYTPGLK